MVTPFAGIRTFVKAPHTIENLDFTVVGVPFDLSTTYRSGARMAPAAIREASLMLTDGDHPKLAVNPVELGLVNDHGDIDVGIMDTHAVYNRVQHALQGIPHPIMLGGDHSLTLSALAAAHAKHGKLSLLQFDAHVDTWDGASNHGTFVRQAIEAGYIDASSSIQLGIRSPAPNRVMQWTEQSGLNWLSAQWIHSQPMDYTVDHVNNVLAQGALPNQATKLPVYLSFDIDALDPSQAPGTGTPEIGGLWTWQAQYLMREFLKRFGKRTVGMDMMEVCPAYDHSNITSLAAATLVWEYLCYHAHNHPKNQL